MLMSTSVKDWVALLIIGLLGAGALIRLMPWAVQHPFVTPPDQWNLLVPGRKRLSEVDVTNLTPFVVGFTTVAVCVMLYGLWMNYSLSRPVVLQRPRGQREDGD